MAPLLDAAAVTSDQVLPLLRLTSILNSAPVPALCVQVIAWTLPTSHVTAVLGDVTVTVPATNANLPLVATAVVLFEETRTIADVVTVPATVQVKLPLLGTDVARDE